MRAWRRRALLLATLCLPLIAAAQQAADTPELYQDALQSIAEGRNKDAFETLTRVIEHEPQHAGAWLDLALIQCSLGNDDEAQRMFAIIETRFNPSQGILDIIGEAREQGCRWRAHSSASLMLSRGVDQNVNQGASSATYVITRPDGSIELPVLSEFLPKHDQYSSLWADYMRDLTANGSVGFVQFQARRNDSLHQYDSEALYAGLETPWRFGRWTLRGTATLGALTLGGRYYQRLGQLQARLGPPLPLPDSFQFNLLAGLTRTQYLTLHNFDANTAEIRGQLSYASAAGYAAASVGRLVDHGNSLRPGGQRDGWLLNLRARRLLGQNVTGELAYTRQSWQGTSAYAPGLIDEVRTQSTQVLRGVLSYALTNNQSVQLEARVVRNKENISIFQYNERLLQLSWQWQKP